MVVRVQGNIEVATAQGFGKTFVFALRVNHDHFRLEHECANDLKLCCIRLTRTAGCKDDGIVVIETKAVENNERGVVAIHAVENTLIGSEVK